MFFSSLSKNNVIVHLNNFLNITSPSADLVFTTIKVNSVNVSFQSYFYNDDTFNFNFAQAKAATGNFKEAEEVCFILFVYYFKNSLCFNKQNLSTKYSCTLDNQ